MRCKNYLRESNFNKKIKNIFYFVKNIIMIIVESMNDIIINFLVLKTFF